MSATGRNVDGHERRDSDFYATPAWVTRALLRDIPDWTPTLDPCCGEGAIIQVCRDERGRAPCGIEVDPMRAAVAATTGPLAALTVASFLGDGLTAPWNDHHVIMNPPFGDAFAWVQKAGSEAASACVFLRLAFLASQRRAAWWRAHPPRFIGVLSKRPSFAHGKTDATDYAWIGWGAALGDWQGCRIAWLAPEAAP